MYNRYVVFENAFARHQIHNVCPCRIRNYSVLQFHIRLPMPNSIKMIDAAATLGYCLCAV